MTSATVFPDTTILIQYKPLNLVDWKAILGVDTVKFVLAPSVIQEIKDIKNQDISSNLATRAAITLQSIENLQTESLKEGSNIKLTFPDEPELDFEAEGLDPNSVADLLVASMVDYQRTFALEYTLLLTEDQETSYKALAAGVEVRGLPKEYRVDIKAKKAAKITPLPALSSPTVPTVVPISSPLSKPTSLFKQPDAPAKEKATAKQETPEKLIPPIKQDVFVNQAASVEQEPPAETPAAKEEPKDKVQQLLSLSDIGLDKLTLPEPPKQKSETPPPPEKQVPIIDIIQEPARPDLHSVNAIHPAEPEANEPEEVEEEQKEALEATEASQNEEDTLQDIPLPDVAAPTVTQSFSFISKAPTPKEPQPVKESFVPVESNQIKEDLRLSIGAEDEFRTTVVIHHPIYPSLDEVNKHLTHVRSNFPKLDLPFQTGGDGLGSDLIIKDLPYGSVTPDTILQRKSQRIKKYNTALDTYYSGIEKYLSDNAEFDNFKRRSARIDLSLFNDLPEDLKSLYISIHFPGNVRVYHEENLPERPATPPPPEEPDLDMLFDPIRLPQVPMPNELSSASDLKMRGRNPAPLEVRWNKGWDVIYSIREIEKNNQIPFNPLYIAFNSFDHATSFRINYRITVASASYEQLGELEVVVRKEI